MTSDSEDEKYESELGTKEHWDKTYEEELELFNNDMETQRNKL